MKRRLLLQFRGSTITPDAGLLAYRELDDTLGLTDTGAGTLADARTGKNGRHRLTGLLRQSVFGRLAGYEDVNDAQRLCRDPAMRWVVSDQAIAGCAVPASQMRRFETKWLSRPENLAALTDLPGQWIDKVQQQQPPRRIVLDMDSSESPAYGEQDGSAYNGQFGCTCYANPETYELLETEGVGYTIRLPANNVLQKRIAYLLKRPVGRPPHGVRRHYASFSYQAQSWNKPRRIVAKVE